MGRRHPRYLLMWMTFGLACCAVEMMQMSMAAL